MAQDSFRRGPLQLSDLRGRLSEFQPGDRIRLSYGVNEKGQERVEHHTVKCVAFPHVVWTFLGYIELPGLRHIVHPRPVVYLEDGGHFEP